jgi:hypothetical protein
MTCAALFGHGHFCDIDIVELLTVTAYLSVIFVRLPTHLPTQQTRVDVAALLGISAFSLDRLLELEPRLLVGAIRATNSCAVPGPHANLRDFLMPATMVLRELRKKFDGWHGNLKVLTCEMHMMIGRSYDLVK